MSGPLTRSAYVDLVDGNLRWLDQQTPTLERDHVRVIVVWSVGGLYDPLPDGGPDAHEWRKSEGPHMERCTRCLATRTISAGRMWEYFDAVQHGSGFTSPNCKPPAGRASGRSLSPKRGKSG